MRITHRYAKFCSTIICPVPDKRHNIAFTKSTFATPIRVSAHKARALELTLKTHLHTALVLALRCLNTAFSCHIKFRRHRKCESQHCKRVLRFNDGSVKLLWLTLLNSESNATLRFHLTPWKARVSHLHQRVEHIMNYYLVKNWIIPKVITAQAWYTSRRHFMIGKFIAVNGNHYNSKLFSTLLSSLFFLCDKCVPRVFSSPSALRKAQGAIFTLLHYYLFLPPLRLLQYLRESWGWYWGEISDYDGTQLNPVFNTLCTISNALISAILLKSKACDPWLHFKES